MLLSQAGQPRFITAEEVAEAVLELCLEGSASANGEAIVHFHQVERGHGAFSRTFEFADKIDVAGVTADLSNGVLTVTLPKVPPPPPRRIEVR